MVSGWSCKLGSGLWSAQSAWSLHQRQSALQLDPKDDDQQWHPQAWPLPTAASPYCVLGSLAPGASRAHLACVGQSPLLSPAPVHCALYANKHV
jgi:hypothetical protein